MTAPTNRLSAAEDRLKRAIDRLETVLDSRSMNTPNIDNGQMNAQLQSLQDENTQLRGLVDETAARLDGTIAKFKEQLAG